MAGGVAGSSSGPTTPQYDPYFNTWTYQGRSYPTYAAAMGATTGGASSTLPPSMQSLSSAGSAPGASDASVYYGGPGGLDSQQTYDSWQAALDRMLKTSLQGSAQQQQTSMANLSTQAEKDLAAQAAGYASAADQAKYQYSSGQAALDRAQQVSMSDLTAQHAKELQAQEQGFESAAAKEAYDRTAEQAALDRAFQTSTTATGVATSRENQDRMMQYIAPFLSSWMGGGTGTTTGTGGGPVTPPVDDDALAQSAQSAAFARAKDQTSDLARSSLMTLRSAAAERGVNVAGGTNPALLSEESRTLQAAQKPLSDLTRQQAIDTSSRAQAVSDRDYAGNIALQGQKASLAPSLISLLKVGGLY